MRNPDTTKSQAPLFEARDVYKYFYISPSFLTKLLARAEEKVVRAVDGVNLAIWPSETVGLVGESGCGKTTTGRCILQLYKVTSGQVHFEDVELTTLKGERLRSIRRNMQLIFQDP
ncbi:MAG: ATP-binding cassette domain-containing protein, partial [Anaerolineales bacterium]|nr:ATP-binding cassette domain-containing protein [Anaerolineales bacterium]